LGTPRLIWRGIADVFEHLLTYMLFSLLWWLGVLLLVTAPPATTALFAVTDPRRAIDQPEARDILAQFRRQAWNSWKLFLIAGPIIGVLIWDLGFYGGGAGGLAVLAPLWLVLLIMAFVITLASIAAMALTESSVLMAFRRGTYVVLSAPFRSFFLLIVGIAYAVIGALLIVPLVLIVPPLIAATFNRLVLTQLQMPVIDPMAPTDERVLEQQVKRSKKSGR
jgi:uncharacterized membrane protein YesL